MFTFFKKPKLSKPETVELEAQQLLLIKLLDDFENYLDKIRTVLNNEQTKNVVDFYDDEEWVDVQDEQKILTNENTHLKCQFLADDEIDAIQPEEEVLNLQLRFEIIICFNNLFKLITRFITFNEQTAATKWYEGTDLTYLLSPNSSFNKKVSASEDFLQVIDDLQDKGSTKQDDVKRNDLFKRLKQKFSILLPPPKLKVKIIIIYRLLCSFVAVNLYTSKFLGD